MVVDFILDLLFGAGEWLVGLLPGMDVVPSGLNSGSWGYEIGNAWRVINHFLPAAEFFEYLPWVLIALGLVAGVRFLISLIPGVG